MTPQRWAISLLIVCHLTALALASVPDPEDLTPVPGPANGDGSAPLVTFVDRTANGLRTSVPAIVRATRPLHVLVDAYNSVGLRQRWNMFSSPMTVDQYVRVDQYVQSDGSSRVRVFRELALPAQREDRIRAVHDFRDKAVLNSFEAFGIGRSRQTAPAPPPRDLEPVARYFRNRFRRDYLTGNERVVRTDVWFGEAPIPPPGQRKTAEQRQSRSETLATYWSGPAETPSVSAWPKIGALQREDAILWHLEYIDEP